MSKDMEPVRVEFYLTKKEVDLLRILADQAFRSVNAQLRVIVRRAVNETHVRNANEALESCPPFISGDYDSNAAATPIEGRIAKDANGNFRTMYFD